MLSPPGPVSCLSKSLLAALVILFVCMTVAEGARIVRTAASVDISGDILLSKRIDAPEDKRSSTAYISERDDTLENDIAEGWFRAAKLSERSPEIVRGDLEK